MTHDKVRQDFEAAYSSGDTICDAMSMARREDGEYEQALARLCYKWFTKGRAAERAEIREKLESEGVVEMIATAMINGLRFHKGCTTAVTGTHAMLDDDAESYKAEAKAAITKILEVI